jgi:dolichol-phosphate mannosyltransferase
MSPLDLSIVLPSYLEEENLRILLPRLNEVIRKMAITAEIIVVDTVTPLDQTHDACATHQAKYVARQGGNHFGDAVRTGIREATGTYVLFMDADGSHTPEFIPELYKHAKDYDVIIASRYIDGGYTENSSSLIWMSRILNLTYSIVLNLRCKDVSNSFKIYRGDILRQVKTRCNNFDIVEEVLFKMSRVKRGLTIHEIPFTFKKRMFGDTKRNLVVFIITYLYTIVRLRLSAW